MKHSKDTLWQSLRCQIGFFCKKDKEYRLKQKAVEKFESQLDIRSFVCANTSLAQLIWLLLSQEQLLLFNYHNDRAVQPD